MYDARPGRIGETDLKSRKLLPVLLAMASVVVACGGSDTTDTAAASTASLTQGASPQQEEQNKALALSLYSQGFNQNKADVVKSALAADFVQHDSTVGSGVDSQVKLFDDIKAKIPGAVATVKHSAADGNCVAVHWQASATPDNENSGQAWVDLYRMANGKAAEHWSVHQDTPATTASGNSLFSDVYKYLNGQPMRTEDQEEANKNLAVEAYSKLTAGDLSAIDQYWDPRYYQHNPRFASGTDVIKNAFSGMSEGSGETLNVFHTLADQDLVWIFQQIDGGIMVDIFRVVDDKIVEHWDVIGSAMSEPSSGSSTPQSR
jgi:predicted SnoaL-like aldol condensation-catalyzing enzyme